MLFGYRVDGEVVQDELALALTDMPCEFTVVDQADDRLGQCPRIVGRSDHDVVPGAELKAGKVVSTHDCDDGDASCHDFQGRGSEPVALEVVGFDIGGGDITGRHIAGRPP